jgi:hypothetical protein
MAATSRTCKKPARVWELVKPTVQMANRMAATVQVISRSFLVSVWPRLKANLHLAVHLPSKLTYPLALGLDPYFGQA